MAISPRIGSNLALELDGQAAGWLRSFQPAPVRVELLKSGPAQDVPLREGVRISLGEMAAEADLIERGPLLDWLASVLGGNLVPRSGAVLVADFNLEQRRRIAFNGALLTALDWPVLDAAEAKRNLTLGLRWLAESVDDRPASGKRQASPPSKRKALLTSNFRVNGLPFGGSLVTRVELPSLSVAWSRAFSGQQRQGGRTMATARLGDLCLSVPARHGEVVRNWVHKLILDGQLDTSEAFNLQVELLDASLKKVQASIDLTGCQFRGLDEDPLGDAEAAGRLALRFEVGRLKLAMA